MRNSTFALACRLVFVFLWLVPALLTGQEAGQEAQPGADPNKSQDESEFETIFDGKTLEGWSGADHFWSVEAGAITGQSTEEHPVKANTFLIWQGPPLEDFELRLKYRIDSGNSGIQFRSRDLGEHRVGGYQADIDAGNHYTGIIYEERGRGILCRRGSALTVAEDGARSESTGTCDEDQLLESLQQDGWNEYVIRAEGNRIEQSINGFVTAVLIDDQAKHARRSGILALQLHAGPPMKVQFKDIRLRRD